MSGKVNTREEMLRASYEFKNLGNCRGCGARIEWWLTTNKRRIPFDPIASDQADAVPHWATCPKANDFAGKAKKALAPIVKESVDAAAMQKTVIQVCERFGLRAAIFLREGGAIYTYKHGIPAEDLRSEIITAANRVRDDIRKGER